MNENKITLYFRDDNPEAVFAYTILNQLGRRKSKVVTQLISGLAEEYGVSDIQDLTLRQLAELKQRILSDFGISEPTKIPTDTGKPAQKPRKPARAHKPAKPIPASKTSESVSEAVPEVPAVVETTVTDDKPAEEVVIKHETVVATTETEREVEVVDNSATDDATEEDEQGYLNEDLLSQLGAFYGE